MSHHHRTLSPFSILADTIQQLLRGVRLIKEMLIGLLFGLRQLLYDYRRGLSCTPCVGYYGKLGLYAPPFQQQTYIRCLLTPAACEFSTEIVAIRELSFAMAYQNKRQHVP